MNNKGFAVTGIIYSVLIIFLVMITMMLFNLQNRKTILDELKLDAVDAVESENNYEYLLNEINELKAQLGSTDISSLGDGTVTGNVSTFYNNFSNIGTIYSKSLSGTYDITLTEAASLTIPTGTYIIEGSVVSSVAVRDIRLYMNDTTLITRSYGSDNSTMNVPNVIGIISVDEETEINMRIQLSSSSTVSGHLKAIRIK